MWRCLNALKVQTVYRSCHGIAQHGVYLLGSLMFDFTTCVYFYTNTSKGMEFSIEKVIRGFKSNEEFSSKNLNWV